MSILTLRIPDSKYERLKLYAKSKGIALLLSSVVSYADKFEGIYISTSNEQINIFKIKKNVYLLSADHFKHRSEGRT